jgi:hypothetical protein
MRWIQLEVVDANGVTHQFDCQVTQAGLTSTGGDAVSLTTLCPTGSFSESTERVWSLVMTGVQDVETAESLMMFLLEHDGEEATFTFYPKVDKNGTPVGRGFQGLVTISPPSQIGNVAAGTWATFTASLGLIGKYTMVDESGNPVTTPATGATAGSPGVWSPGGSVPPADMASAPPLTGTPAWATDQYVATAQGSPAGDITWNGTAWLGYTGPKKGAAAPGNTFPSDSTITASDATNATKLTTNGYVAVPLTAWATAEKITVNGFDFHWSGTAWATGAAAVLAASAAQSKY